MFIPMPYLLPTFVYKNEIYYQNNKDADEPMMMTRIILIIA